MREIIKIAVASIDPADIKVGAADKDDPEILKYFKKTASDLKAIAPKAKDFLYFTCVMMHSAEASLYDENGELKKRADGSDVRASWSKLSNGSWVWETNDSSVLPYKNSNNDIFPEEELKKAYKKWVGKPLCLDHQSQSVDMIRGVIIDTVYDDKKKRVIALCALDKENYPDLARKVASGVAASVSMGTAVGRAICTEKGCHRVARVESEFCEHMRSRSCYGEINVDLSPIELSIVVNGADPKAKIRRVIAAAGKVAGYVDSHNLDEAGITLDEAQSLKQDLETKIKELQAAAGDNSPLPNEGEEIEPPYGQGGRAQRDIPEPTDDIVPTGNVPQAASEARFASEVVDILDKLREKVGQLDNFINKMASVKEGSNNINEDTVMADYKKGYFLGGGGVNEPAPHQVKYPKEDSDSIRNNDDKQMNGQTPFPDVGPVDGMHPGHDSFGESEEARKKRLQRLAAEQEQRALRREAAMNKAKDVIRQRREAYFNDRPESDPNEPAPHKTKYPNETDYTKIRDNDDKQMNGEKPFPDVGDTKGLYGDDEKQKKMLNRAKLNASFVKAARPDGSDDFAKSCWNVYAKDEAGNKRLVLSATVQELAGKDRVSSLYAGIATSEYGRKIIETIRTAGLEAAHEIFKGAQATAGDFVVVLPGGKGYRELSLEDWSLFADQGFHQGTEVPGGKVYSRSFAEERGVKPVGGMPSMDMPLGASAKPKGKTVNAQAVPAQAGPGAMPGAAPDAAAPAPMPAADPAVGMEDDPSYAGEDGSPLDKIEDSVRELGNLTAEMEKGLEALKEEQGELEAAPEEMPAEGGVPVMAMRSQLNKALVKGFKQAIAKAEDIKEELELVKHVVATGGVDDSNRELVTELYKDASADVVKAKGDIKTMLESFVAYANGNEIMAKVAQMAPAVEQVSTPEDMKGTTMEHNNEGMGTLEDLLAGAGDDADLMFGDDEDKKKPEDKKEDDKKKEDDDSDEEDEDEDDKNDVVKVTDEGIEADSSEELKGLDLEKLTRAERDLLRVKLAQKGLTFSDMLQKAHPQGGTTTDLDVKPQDKGDHVEDLKESHDVHMDVATSAPRNVRNAAEKIQRLVTAGEINPEKDFPALIAEGLDPQAVAYWKKLWGGADPDASQFVGDLVKDYQTKKAADEKQNLQVKIARAYELAYAMAERGLISRNPASLRQQVNRVMQYDEPSFNDFAQTISKLPAKTASLSDVASLNGVNTDNDRVVTATNAVVPPAAGAGNVDLVGLFDQAFSGRKY